MSPSAADDLQCPRHRVAWHACCMLLDGPIAAPSARRRPSRFGSGKFRASVVASLRGRCPSKPSSPAVCLRSERSEVRRATHVRPVSWHLCFRPRQLPREGTCSSSSHASPLLLPSGHLVVPLSPSPSPSLLRVRVLVCMVVCWFVFKTLLVSGCLPSPSTLPSLPPSPSRARSSSSSSSLSSCPCSIFIFMLDPRSRVPSRPAHLTHRLGSPASRLHLPSAICHLPPAPPRARVARWM